MVALQTVTWRAATLGRWIALILGSLMVLLFLAFFFGEGPPRLSALTAVDGLLFAAMGALFLGLALAWKWEGLGGLLSVAGFAALVATGRIHLRVWTLDAPAAIAVVHLACWWRLRAGPPAALPSWRVSRTALLSLGAERRLESRRCRPEGPRHENREWQTTKCDGLPHRVAYSARRV